MRHVISSRIIATSSLVLSLSLPLTFSCHTSAAVVTQSDYGFVVENHVEVAQPIESSWQHFVDDIDQWWPKDHTGWGEKSTLSLDAKAGGCFCEVAAKEGHSAEHMRVSFVEKHTLLRLTGGLGPLQGMGMYGALDFKFEPVNANSTRITMRYQANGYNPKSNEQLVPIVDKVQAIQIGQFKQYMEKSLTAK